MFCYAENIYGRECQTAGTSMGRPRFVIKNDREIQEETRENKKSKIIAKKA